MFLESICTADEIVESNVREVKVHSPDYKGVEANEAIIDFLERIGHYEAIYEPICEETESHLAFIKLYNAGEKYVIHKHEGYLQVTNHSQPPWSRDLADQWHVSRARSCTGS